MPSNEHAAYVLSRYRALRTDDSPLTAMGKLRDEFANSYCEAKVDDTLHHAELSFMRWHIARDYFTRILYRTGVPGKAGTFWLTGRITSAPTGWGWAITRLGILQKSGACPTLPCAVKHAYGAADGRVRDACIVFPRKNPHNRYLFHVVEPLPDVLRKIERRAARQ